RNPAPGRPVDARVKAVVDGLPAGGHFADHRSRYGSTGIQFQFPPSGAPHPMSKRLVLSALAQFTAKTAGRNMTKAAYAAVAAGVAAMAALTTVPPHEAVHRGVVAVLWMCLGYFVFEWLVRLRHMARQG